MNTKNNLNNSEKNTFDLTFTWIEKCMATVTVEANSLEEARSKVSSNIENYLDYCINRGETELLEREYETLQISSAKESTEFTKHNVIKDLDSELF